MRYRLNCSALILSLHVVVGLLQWNFWGDNGTD